MRGKYSPTVSQAYQTNQEWHQKLLPPGEYTYDADGYDSYGYDKNDVDRAGNHEYEYYSNDLGEDCSLKYEDAYSAWGFDGVRPVSHN